MCYGSRRFVSGGDISCRECEDPVTEGSPGWKIRPVQKQRLGLAYRNACLEESRAEKCLAFSNRASSWHCLGVSPKTALNKRMK